MKKLFKLYNVVDLRLVDVRRYNGIENGLNSWTFLGYDVVEIDKEGKANSIFDENDIKAKYEFLKPMDGDKKGRYFDHDGLVKGDVRIKTFDHLHDEMFGDFSVVSFLYIKAWIKNRPEFEFLNYKPNNEKVKGKVKKLEKKK